MIMKFAKLAKKGICAFLATAMVAGTISGCSGQDGESWFR